MLPPTVRSFTSPWRLVALVVVLAGSARLPADRSAAAADAPLACVDNVIDLTMEQAVCLAIGNSRQLRSLNTRVAMRAQRCQSPDWLDNPELRVRNLSTRSSDRGFDELEVGIRWRPPALGQRAAERQQGQVLLWERKVEAQRARDWLASRVRRACADVLMCRELVRIAAARVGIEVERIAQIETMVDMGRRTIVYSIKSGMVVNEARNEHVRSLHRLNEEERRLRRLTGAEAPLAVAVTPLPRIGQEQEQLLALASANRPEVPLAQEQKRLAVQVHNRERLSLVPWLSFVEVSHHRERGASDWREFMLGVDIPVLGRNNGAIRAARLGVARKETQSLAIRERIQDEVYEAFANYNEARLAWQLAKADGERMAVIAQQVIDQAATHGTVPPDEVLELERAIMDSQVIAVRRRRELAHALYFLYYALGIEAPLDPGADPGTDAVGNGD